jgi:hypothetical protein
MAKQAGLATVLKADCGVKAMGFEYSAIRKAEENEVAQISNLPNRSANKSFMVSAGFLPVFVQQCARAQKACLQVWQNKRVNIRSAM